jgi:hypothetical protein
VNVIAQMSMLTKYLTRDIRHPFGANSPVESKTVYSNYLLFGCRI